VMVLALVAFAVFGRVERALSLEAALVLPGERHYLVAPASGTVEDVYVELADTVALGQPVAYIRPADAQRWESAIVGIIEDLEKGGRLEEETRVELLQALLDAGSAASSAAQTEVTSPLGGEVVALDLVPGQAVDAGASVGLVRATSTGLPEALAFVSPSEAASLSAGMEARVGFGGPNDGARQVFRGQVAEVSALLGTPPRWLAAQGLAIPQEAHLLRVALAGNEPNAALADGSVVSLRIVLGRESLVSLLAPWSGG